MSTPSPSGTVSGIPAVGPPARPAGPGCRSSAETGIGAVLRAVHLTQAGLIADIAGRIGLTGPQLSVLAAVDKEPGMDQRTLTRVTFIDRSTVAAVVTKLTGRGLLRSDRNPRDARRASLIASDNGRALLYGVSPQVHHCNGALLGPLSDDERAGLLDDLRVLVRAAGECDPKGYAVPGGSWGLGRALRGGLQHYGRCWTALGPTDLTPAQFLALAVLARRHGEDQTSLGGELRLDKASTAEMVRRLLARGLVVKRRDPQDGRRRLIGNSPDGAALLARAEFGRAVVERRFLAPLESARADALARVLRRVGGC